MRFEPVEEEQVRKKLDAQIGNGANNHDDDEVDRKCNFVPKNVQFELFPKKPSFGSYAFWEKNNLFNPRLPRALPQNKDNQSEASDDDKDINEGKKPRRNNPKAASLGQSPKSRDEVENTYFYPMLVDKPLRF